MRSKGDVVFAPVLRGVTIWSAAPPADRAVCVSPNWFGVPEREDLVADLGIPVRWIDANVSDPAGCRHLVKAMLQGPGTHAPHGRPTTNVTVILLPVDAGHLLSRAPAPDAIGAVPLVDHPGLPGGVRLEVRPGTEAGTLARYAAEVVDVIRQESTL